MAKIYNIRETAKNISMFVFDIEMNGVKMKLEAKVGKLDGKYKVLLSRENTPEYNKALLELEKMINAGQYEGLE